MLIEAFRLVDANNPATECVNEDYIVAKLCFWRTRTEADTRQNCLKYYELITHYEDGTLGGPPGKVSGIADRGSRRSGLASSLAFDALVPEHPHRKSAPCRL
jgi:hypothetical protein